MTEKFQAQMRLYEARIGEVSTKAVEVGGEKLLDEVTQHLGVASRHLERIRTGKLWFAPGIVHEIEASIDRARKHAGVV